LRQRLVTDQPSPFILPFRNKKSPPSQCREHRGTPYHLTRRWMLRMKAGVRVALLLPCFLIAMPFAAEGHVWDSHQVKSNQSASVRYVGPALAAFKRYYWRVKVWNRNGLIRRATPPGGKAA
jgi:hypothetical protein